MIEIPTTRVVAAERDVEWLWTWCGASFGYRLGDSLFTFGGVEVGRFHGDDLYGEDGDYVGEQLKDDRLVIRPTKKNWSKQRFMAVRGPVFKARARREAYSMYAGYLDFPSPEQFEQPVQGSHEQSARKLMDAEDGEP